MSPNWYYTRGQCGGDLRRIWVGHQPPDRKQTGREVVFYGSERCLCLFVVPNPELAEILFKLPQLRPDQCVTIPPLAVR